MREMKDSGVPWIGEIPEAWRLEILKNSLKQINESNSPIKTTSVLSLTNKLGVVPYEEKGDQGNKAKENYEEYKLAYPNTLVVNSMNVLIGSVGISKYFGCVSPVYYVFHEIEGKSDLRFVNYVFQIPSFQKELRRYANGILEIRLRISSYDLLHRPIPFPALPEQRRIADFLDAKCAEIDAILENTRASIEEYKALKMSVITESVTKGIRGERPMRDSGVEWIEEIPTEWDVLGFYRSNYIRGRLGWKGLKADEYVSEGYPFLSAFNIIENHLDWSELNYITQERYDESPEIKLSVGDLLIVKDGAGIGKCARIDELPLGEATVNSSLAVITPSERFDHRYEYYYMQSAPFQHVIWFLKIGMGVPHLTQEKMREISIPCPTLDEQEEIAAYLDEKCATIDSLIASKEALIAELEAYRKSIIYEYVTGKKEVPAV